MSIFLTCGINPENFVFAYDFFLFICPNGGDVELGVGAVRNYSELETVSSEPGGTDCSDARAKDHVIPRRVGIGRLDALRQLVSLEMRVGVLLVPVYIQSELLE